MARKATPPSYSLHKGSGQAFTRINGRMIYLGEYNTAASRRKYAGIVADWSAGNLEKYGESASVARLAVAYTRHAEGYYLKNGKLTSHMCAVRSALKMLVNHFGHFSTNQFQPYHLEKLQQHFTDSGLTRYTTNRYINIIRQMFRFGVTKGTVPHATWQALLAVRNLQRGRCEAKETNPVLPVSPLDVIKTLRELGPIVAAMVWLQYTTFMRLGKLFLQ